jgi:hypothetical protein
MRNRKYGTLLLVVLVITCTRGMSQVPQFATVPNLQHGDSTNIIHLIKNGIEVRKGKVIGWFPKDSLSREQLDKILDTLDLGIGAAEMLIKAPHAWQVQQKGKPYTFYFRLDSFISHASGAGFVSIPFWRIKQRKAPWLHEAIHEMLNAKAGNWLSDSITDEVWAKNMPLWLSEGLPDYISMRVSQKHNLPLFDVFTNSLLTNVDSVCKKDLKGNKADSILFFIGKRGAMPALFGNERRLYAPTFYHCSCSFVKYLAERTGLDPLVASLAAFPNEMEELDKRISVPIEELKRLWLIQINGR